MLDGVLQILQGEDELQQGVRVQLEAGGVLCTLGHVVSLIEHDYTVLVVEGVIGAHGLVEHVVVGHQDEVSLAGSLLVHVERADL